MPTLRVKFSKKSDLKYISHLDLMRLFQRAFRRGNIGVKYSQGFNPHPKFSFATALPLGVSSDAEYADIELVEEMDASHFINKMNDVLPEGINIYKARYVNNSKSIMSLIRWSSYIFEVKILTNLDKFSIKDEIEKFLSKNVIIIIKEKKKKNRNIKSEENIRNKIKDIDILSIEENKIILKSILMTGSKGNLKPDVFIRALKENTDIDMDLESLKIHRLELFLESNEGLLYPVM